MQKYKRLRIGKLEGEEEKIPFEEELFSDVPYAEMPLQRSGWVDSPYMGIYCNDGLRYDILDYEKIG